MAGNSKRQGATRKTGSKKGMVVGSGGHHAGVLIVRQDNDRARDMTDAQIVTAVHRRAPSAETLVTPIIASRVTSSASCASLMRSVPAGRSGKTM